MKVTMRHVENVQESVKKSSVKWLPRRELLLQEEINRSGMEEEGL